ncbi:MAG: GPP34 family phosphoprotein [Marmoricola sp.]
MTTLIAEDLLLLLLEDDSGKLTNATYVDVGLGGALLVELALGGAVEVVKGAGLWARAKVVPAGAVPSDPVLVEAMRVVSEKQRTAQDLVARLGKKRRDALLERLEGKGILERREDRAMGLFPRTRWPAVDSSHEADVRRQLGDALVRGVQPAERIAALIALLSALDLAHKVVDREGVPARDVKKRAKTVADGDWAAKAVRDSIVAAQAAVAAAAVAATTVASTGG